MANQRTRSNTGRQAAQIHSASDPAISLYNKAGLPALPFRTDDWPGVTANNR